jgi:Ricin-type beta-trefoil lectin domain
MHRQVEEFTMRTWHRRSSASLVALALLGLAAVGTATSSAAAAKPATTLSYYKFVNYDGKCLDAAGGSGTGKVQQYGCNNNLWQYWAVYPSGKNGDLIQNYWTGQCLAADGNSPGSAVIQRACNPSSNAQNWYYNYTGSGAWEYYLSYQVSGGCDILAETEFGMHPSGGSSQDGKGIYIQFPNPQNNLHSFWWELGAQL